jgi:hypothetical protein
MAMEKEYTCWHSQQSEAMGRSLKAPGPEAAARKALDIWKHETGDDNFQQQITTVKVRDPDNKIIEVPVNQNQRQ